MKNLRVSVIITTKNSAKTILMLLKSIKNQTYKNIEIIVVDNFSNDKTKELARKFTSKIFNKGPERSAQRNYGVRRARGKYLLVLDADMELLPKVVEDCLRTVCLTGNRVLVIPERTIGQGFIPKIRQFEREMYVGDLSIEVARFFEKSVFGEFGGYDVGLTGPEDYDLPYRISKKYKIGRSHEYIFHNEKGSSLSLLLKKKFYYAYHGAVYAKKHPELVRTQGNLLFRKAYFRNWKKFIKHPILGIAFIVVRILETICAIGGYVGVVGVKEFLKTLFNMLKLGR